VSEALAESGLAIFDILATTIGARMHESIKAHFAELQTALEGTTLSDERKQFVASSVAKLAALYAQFRETNMSRFGDEISRLVQAVLHHLQECPEASKLDADFRHGLHSLHQELGIPRLSLKPVKVPPKPKKRSKA
jgi:hypothetical protein